MPQTPQKPKQTPSQQSRPLTDEVEEQQNNLKILQSKNQEALGEQKIQNNFKILRYLTTFILYLLLGLSVGIMYLIFTMPEQEVPESFYPGIKASLIKTCPTLQGQVQEFVTNDGKFDIKEYKIFYDSCKTLYDINHPPKILKKKMKKGEMFT